MFGAISETIRILFSFSSFTVHSYSSNRVYEIQVSNSKSNILKTNIQVLSNPGILYSNRLMLRNDGREILKVFFFL